MAKPRMEGFQKPADSGQRKKVRVAVIRTVTRGDGSQFVACSCGQPFLQQREKPRNAAIDRHIQTKHDGQAMWL